MKTSILPLILVSTAACGSAKNASDWVAVAAQAKAVTDGTQSPGQLSAPNAAPAGLATFNVTPQGCEATDVQTLDNGTGLLHLVLANCSLNNQVYAVPTGYEGTAAGPGKLLSDCRNGVVDFTADKGPSGFVLAYTCRISTGSYQVSSRQVLSNLTTGQAYAIRNLSGVADTKPFTGMLRWNPDANAFGFAAQGFFQRISSLGMPVGGPIALAQDGPVEDVTASGGDWLILQHATLNSEICSSVSKNGVPTVQAQALGLHPEGANQDDATVFIGGQVLGYGQNAEAWRVSGLTNCQGSQAPGLAQGQVSGQLHGGINIDGNFAGVLFTHNNSLVYAVVQTQGAEQLISKTPIAGQVDSAKIAQTKGKVFVSYAVGGNATVAYGAAH